MRTSFASSAVLTEDTMLDAVTVAALLHRARVVTESRTAFSAWTAGELRASSLISMG